MNTVSQARPESVKDRLDGSLFGYILAENDGEWVRVRVEHLDASWEDVVARIEYAHRSVPAFTADDGRELPLDSVAIVRFF